MSEEQFNSDIRSYDVHTYFFQSYGPSKQEGHALREKFQVDFAKEIDTGKVRVFKFHDYPLGPHPYGMWECDFRTQEMFAKVVPWFQINHGSLSVLVHPHTGDGYKDHTHHAMWIGKQVPLIEEILKVQ
jgi:aromatic ring-cleaving dioxygenase